jgi:Icc-related predicted phosphoesterase
MARPIRLFFATDLHGSSKCFRKFLNAAEAYRVDVLVLGADLCGKALQTIVRQGPGRWHCRFIGTEYDVGDGPELEQLEKLIEDHGYYPLRVEPGEFERLEADGRVDDVFLELMARRLRGWLELADQRLRPRGVPIFMMLGNDDPASLQAVLAESSWATPAEGNVLTLDDAGVELASWGYSNVTPWHSHREQTEEQLDASLRRVLAGVSDPTRTILNVHVPPIASGLDDAPVLDPNLRVVQVLGQVKFAPAGSSAVRSIIEEFQPLIGLHGHIHEASGIRRIGRTIAINPGSDYSTGTLNGALLTLEAGKVKAHQLVRG